MDSGIRSTLLTRLSHQRRPQVLPPAERVSFLVAPAWSVTASFMASASLTCLPSRTGSIQRSGKNARPSSNSFLLLRSRARPSFQPSLLALDSLQPLFEVLASCRLRLGKNGARRQLTRFALGRSWCISIGLTSMPRVTLTGLDQGSGAMP